MSEVCPVGRLVQPANVSEAQPVPAMTLESSGLGNLDMQTDSQFFLFPVIVLQTIHKR